MSFFFRFYCVLPRGPVLLATNNLRCFPRLPGEFLPMFPMHLMPHALRAFSCASSVRFFLSPVCTTLPFTVFHAHMGFEGVDPPLRLFRTRFPLHHAFPVPSSCVSCVTMCYPIQGGVRSSGVPPGTFLHFSFPASLAFFCSHFKGTQSPLGPCLPGH